MYLSFCDRDDVVSSYNRCPLLSVQLIYPSDLAGFLVKNYVDFSPGWFLKLVIVIYVTDWIMPIIVVCFAACHVSPRRPMMLSLISN